MSDQATFIQWKGTDLCMDLYCPKCKQHSHIDGLFAYYIQCPFCFEVYLMPTNIKLTPVRYTTLPDMVVIGVKCE